MFRDKLESLKTVSSTLNSMDLDKFSSRYQPLIYAGVLHSLNNQKISELRVTNSEFDCCYPSNPPQHIKSDGELLATIAGQLDDLYYPESEFKEQVTQMQLQVNELCNRPQAESTNSNTNPILIMSNNKISSIFVIDISISLKYERVYNLRTNMHYAILRFVMLKDICSCILLIS